MTLYKHLPALALVLSSATGCFHVPPSIKLYAAELPARADGQYAVLDDVLKKQLVMKDALLQCAIDSDEGSQKDSAACKCAESAAEDWVADCKAWLGPHAPQTQSAPPEPEPTTNNS
jgi:hypothetical protein